ncbi:MAG: hypothetical protein KatS3mg003_2285 [Candidatus Nitrosocaldaceae archaeon]|nr:MAG: hypothetical protein KatS3mg003_2285 [Candidatus Nitrosocaldaceae archaeon]
MLASILDELICPKCNSKLELEAIKSIGEECIEGFLYCKCNSYPIIEGIAIVMDDIYGYFASRRSILDHLLINSGGKMKEYLIDVARSISKDFRTDRYEKQALQLYKHIDINFYRCIANKIIDLNSNECLEVGSGTGVLTNLIANRMEIAIGVDRSFNMVKRSRKNKHKNAEFIVADISSLPFRKFDTIAALNIIDLFKPERFIRSVKRIIANKLVLVDPYDFRDENGDPVEMYDGIKIRGILEEEGFKIDDNSKDEQYIPWLLRINRRAYMIYLTDLIIASLV